MIKELMLFFLLFLIILEEGQLHSYMEDLDRIFVYGTLMQGFSNHEVYLANHIVEMCRGTLKGRLYHLRYGYPAAVDGEGIVRGEIYTVENLPKLLPALDYLEDYNQPGQEDLYERHVREVRDEKGNITLCYVYLWSYRRLFELEQNGVYINHGDWKKFIRE